MNEHVNSSILDCSNMLCALNTLRAHGMNNEDLQEVFRDFQFQIRRLLTFRVIFWMNFDL